MSTQSRIDELDGLRAVAVLLVFLSHAFPEVFPGGFIGVDYSLL
jgi:peptidoglycan/LPS O-acetylase OafA/YrhL